MTGCYCCRRRSGGHCSNLTPGFLQRFALLANALLAAQNDHGRPWFRSTKLNIPRSCWKPSKAGTGKKALEDNYHHQQNFRTIRSTKQLQFDCEAKPFALSKLHSFRLFELKSDLLGTHCSGTARSLQASKTCSQTEGLLCTGKTEQTQHPTVSLKTYNHCFTDQLKTKQTQRRTGLVLGTAQTDSKREPHEFQLIPPDKQT